MTGYNEQFHTSQTGPALADDYQEAHRFVGDDDQWVVWPARVDRDASEGLTYEQSLAKHRPEWRRALGLDQPPSPTPGTFSRLRRQGRWLVNDQGKYVWRMTTAFRLVHMMSAGEDPSQFLDWCAVHGVGVRIFTMCNNMFRLDPATGRHLLLSALSLTHARGIPTNVVCIADKYDQHGIEVFPGTDYPAHVEEIGHICAGFANTYVEGVNEPSQVWQRYEPGQIQMMMRRIPAIVPWTAGAPDGADDESIEYRVDGESAGLGHTDRSGSVWRIARHIREQQVISDKLKLYMGDDEPENAVRMTEQSLFACGGIAGVMDIGQTHHAEFGKFCRLPSSDEQQWFDARKRGWDCIPHDFQGTFANYKWVHPNPEPPIESATFLSADGRAYSSITDNECYTVLSHAKDPQFKSGWHADRVDGDDQASVWRCVR